MLYLRSYMLPPVYVIENYESVTRAVYLQNFCWSSKYDIHESRCSRLLVLSNVMRCFHACWHVKHLNSPFVSRPACLYVCLITCDAGSQRCGGINFWCGIDRCSARNLITGIVFGYAYIFCRTTRHIFVLFVSLIFMPRFAILREFQS